MIYVVYLHTNTVNGNQYIGYSKHSVEKRFDGHVKDAKRGSKCVFHQAIRKYGREVFLSYALSYAATKAAAKEIERRYISEYKPEYNMTSGGDGAPDIVFTEEYRANLSKSQTGRKHPQEVKDKISASNKNRVVPQHSIEAVIESNKRRRGEKRPPRTQEAKDAISLKNKGRPPPNKGKKVALTEAMIEGNKKSAETRRGKKRGPYKIKAERSEAQKTADARRTGVKRGPYKKGNQKEAAIKRAATFEGQQHLRNASKKAAQKLEEKKFSKGAENLNG